MMFKQTFLAVIAAALTGCATTDVLTDGSLDAEMQSTAMEIAQMTRMRCGTYRYIENPDRPATGMMSAAELPKMIRLHKSNSGWFMADVMMNSTFDSVYYNRSELKFVCGQKSWEKMYESREVTFRKVAPLDTPAQNSINAANSVPAVVVQTRIKEEKLKELKSLYERRLITESQYNSQVSEVLSGK